MKNCSTLVDAMVYAFKSMDEHYIQKTTHSSFMVVNDPITYPTTYTPGTEEFLMELNCVDGFAQWKVLKNTITSWVHNPLSKEGVNAELAVVQLEMEILNQIKEFLHEKENHNPST